MSRKKQPPPKPNFTKAVLRVKDNHSWKCPPGYKVLVIDRGAASFNIPEDWLMMGMEPLELHNALPPKDDARLMVHVFRAPSVVDWTGLPLVPFFEEQIQKGYPDTEILARTPLVPLQRPDHELVWLQQKWIDKAENREAFSRIAMARGPGMHLFITFDYWVDQADQFEPVWDQVIESLQMGRYIADPTKGPTLH
jgi:hypothetical protein